MVRRWTGWLVLGGLLFILLLGAATFDRSSWPTVVGDEATYLMQAESLAFDFDLTYERGDYERFVELHGIVPEGLILQAGDSDEPPTLTYGKPFVYGVATAPFVRLSPTRGPFVANAFYLALAALAAAFVLSRHLGPSAPLWVAAFVFGSVTFAYVFWAHMDLLLLVLVTISLALAYGSGRESGGPSPEVWEDAATKSLLRFALPWAASGALLGVVTLVRPFYGALFLPLLFAVPKERRGAGLGALLGGAAVVLVLLTGVNLVLHGTWSSYGGERMGFYSYTGFPEVDFPTERWDERLAERPGKGSWIAADRLVFDVKPRVYAYDALYFLIGRHVGVLPYFLPLLLGLVAFRRDRGRWALPLAVLLAVAGFFYVRSFNFWGGGGALANRYFLPLYPAFWYLAARPVRMPAVWPILSMLAATPFLLPLWSAPREFPLENGGYRWVSDVAREYLPYETTQDHLKPSGRDDVTHGALWVKPLTPAVRSRRGGAELVFDPSKGETLELLVGRQTPLESLAVTFQGDAAPARLGAIEGGELGFSAFTPDGGTVFEIVLDDKPYARHRMWWTEDEWSLYRLELTLPEGFGRRVPFRLEAGGG